MEAEWDALTRRLDSELVDDEETLLHDSMAALRALAEDDGAEPDASPVQPSREDSELDRVLAALHEQSDEANEPLSADTKEPVEAAASTSHRTVEQPSTAKLVTPEKKTAQKKTREKKPKKRANEATTAPKPKPANKPDPVAEKPKPKPEPVAEEPKPVEEPEADVPTGNRIGGSRRADDKRSAVVRPGAGQSGDEVELTDADQDEAVPSFMAEWVHSTDEHPVIREDQPLTDVLGVDLATEEVDASTTLVDSVAEEPETTKRDDDHVHRRTPNAFTALTAETPAPTSIAPDSAAQPTDTALELPSDRHSGEIVAVGAARIQPIHAQSPVVVSPEPEAMPASASTVPAAVATNRAGPPSPWAPRIAAMTGMAILIAGSAVLWISLLGTPGGSDETPAGSGTLASSVEAVEDTVQTADETVAAVDAGEIENATLLVNDDQIEAVITRCGQEGVEGELATKGSEWVTARVQASFQTGTGDLLTESQPQEELVPTTIRVPFRFSYDQTLAPAGLQDESPHCVVTVDLVSQP